VRSGQTYLHLLIPFPPSLSHSTIVVTILYIRELGSVLEPFLVSMDYVEPTLQLSGTDCLLARINEEVVAVLGNVYLCSKECLLVYEYTVYRINNKQSFPLEG
jgi:hypothetical protein